MNGLLQHIEFLWPWLYVLTFATIITLLGALVKPLLIHKLEKFSAQTTTKIDDAMVDMLRATHLWLLAVVAFAIGAHLMELNGSALKISKSVGTLAVFFQIGLWASALLQAWLNRSREQALLSDVSAATSLSAIGFIGKIVLWAVISLVALDNLGVNITTLIAGLGVGGVAVALAVQNILGDLFASLSIVIDKPFVIGDFIIIDDYIGTVENVGLKTTRIRSLGGEQIVFANSDLLKNRVRNYKRMFERRIVFNFGVLYQTTSDQLESVPGLVRAIIEKQDKVRFDRVHCQKFGDSSIDFEAVYWVLDPDYNLYMDIQQAINFQIKRRFAETGIDFAYPTRTIVIDGSLRLERHAVAKAG
ncbi:MAG: mechanosensitive ion channel family protein [Burkholderiaceae bacterium]|jgi:small-conductance mechanosensitive channel|nr:mechanosensitive ion channel family protein [Burkholderiaceae bacterium]